MIEHFEHIKMAEKRAAHPDWIWNRSDTHVFVAVPGTHESFKTVVEPGNSFSPGPGSYGVSTWVFVDGKLHAPEEKPLDELVWSWEDGGLPVLVAEWQAGPIDVLSRLFADGDPNRFDVKNYLRVQLANRTARPQEVKFYLTIRSFGAAGGPLQRLATRHETLLINDKPLVYMARPGWRFGTISYAATSSDVSCSLREGILPSDDDVKDESSWASGALEYEVTLPPDATAHYDFVFHVQAGHRMLNWLQPPTTTDYALAESDFLRRYRAQSSIQIDVPNQSFVDCFGATINQLYSFTVGDAPRIAPITYPLWWMRDCAYVVVALDRAGLHDFAHRACLDAIRTDAMTGFGGEADVPGEAIWMLSEHYLNTRDDEYLRLAWPFIQRKADLLVRARHTETPIRLSYEFITHEWGLSPVTDLFCAPAHQGLIVGRMDHHYPLYWVNAFAYLGLKRAAECAQILGMEGATYAAEAVSLRMALHDLSTDSKAGFGKNERDVVAAYWPCTWPEVDDEVVAKVFDDWWQMKRAPGGTYNPERLWTYFPVGEAHNYLLLGQRDRVWQTIEWYFANQSAFGTYGWPEGNRDENSALLLWEKTRGWDKMNWVTPTGWTLAEMFLLLRDCMVREEDNTLILGQGVPVEWMDKPFSITNLPTHFGAVSYRHDPETRTLTVQIERATECTVKSAFPSEVCIVKTEIV